MLSLTTSEVRTKPPHWISLFRVWRPVSPILAARSWMFSAANCNIDSRNRRAPPLQRDLEKRRHHKRPPRQVRPRVHPHEHLVSVLVTNQGSPVPQQRVKAS